MWTVERYGMSLCYSKANIFQNFEALIRYTGIHLSKYEYYIKVHIFRHPNVTQSSSKSVYKV